jgi:hypothetical protein
MDAMPSSGGPGVGTERESRALCKLSSMPSIKSGKFNQNCSIGHILPYIVPDVNVVFDIVITEL